MPKKAASAGKVPKYLKDAVEKMVKAALDDPKSSLTDRCKAIDRGLKLAAIEAKLDDPGYGAGFGAEED